MKKTIIVTCLIFVGLLIFLSGCTQVEVMPDNSNGQGNNGGSTTGTTYTMNATQVDKDMNETTDWATYYKLLYNSLDDGDT